MGRKHSHGGSRRDTADDPLIGGAGTALERAKASEREHRRLADYAVSQGLHPGLAAQVAAIAMQENRRTGIDPRKYVAFIARYSGQPAARDRSRSAWSRFRRRVAFAVHAMLHG